MKTILVILDGASEEKVEVLNNKSPLEYAETPILDRIMKHGSSKKVKFYPPDRTPDSLSCILTILGVNQIPKNRAYLEALAANININEEEVALRCNLVSIKNGRLESFNGKGLSKTQMELVCSSAKVSKNMELYHISNYRNIITVNKREITSVLKDMPPHENVGISVDLLIENIRNIKILNNFIEENKFTLNNIDYMLYPWGISEKVKLPAFHELHDKTCSCICNAEIVKGIAKAMKIDTPLLKNSTGDVDTNLMEKAEVVLREIQSHDVVIAHINGTDEVSHRRDLFGKVKFIEKIDREFLSPIFEQAMQDVNIIITADHQTSSITGKHEKGFVDVFSNYKKYGFR